MILLAKNVNKTVDKPVESSLEMVNRRQDSRRGSGSLECLASGDKKQSPFTCLISTLTADQVMI